MRDTEGEAETQAEGEAGLDPRTLGSGPEPKAEAQPLSHPGAPKFILKGSSYTGVLELTHTGFEEVTAEF